MTTTTNNLTDMQLDELWAQREAWDAEIKSCYDQRNRIDTELERRFEREHEGFTEASGGTAQLTGREIIITLGFDRVYAVNDAAVMELLQSELLTPAEFQELVTYDTKVNGTKFNALLRRGAEYEAALSKVRYLKSARPKYEAKARK